MYPEGPHEFRSTHGSQWANPEKGPGCLTLLIWLLLLLSDLIPLLGPETREEFAPHPPPELPSLRNSGFAMGSLGQRFHQAFSCLNTCTFAKSFPPMA